MREKEAISRHAILQEELDEAEELLERACVERDILSRMLKFTDSDDFNESSQMQKTITGIKERITAIQSLLDEEEKILSKIINQHFWCTIEIRNRG